VTTTPIADALGNIEQTADGYPDLPRRGEDYLLRAAKVDDELPPEDFMGDLLEAQHQFIGAQHNFMHDSNVAALFQAQDTLIAKQSQVILRLLGKR
jgi:hypothetical protein